LLNLRDVQLKQAVQPRHQLLSKAKKQPVSAAIRLYLKWFMPFQPTLTRPWCSIAFPRSTQVYTVRLSDGEEERKRGQNDSESERLAEQENTAYRANSRKGNKDRIEV
jgi:hypothetical protein